MFSLEGRRTGSRRLPLELRLRAGPQGCSKGPGLRGGQGCPHTPWVKSAGCWARMALLASVQRGLLANPVSIKMGSLFFLLSFSRFFYIFGRIGYCAELRLKVSVEMEKSPRLWGQADLRLNAGFATHYPCNIK